MTWLRALAIGFALLVGGPVAAVAFGEVQVAADWRTASRDSAGIAPRAADTPEAVVQVYAARAFGWRGAFAVHTWIALKPAGAGEYLVLQKIGWRYYHGADVVVVANDIPDRRWFGAVPDVIAELRGAEAEAAIGKILQAADDYPYRDFYRLWPGPNSNTFIAFIGRRVPELRLSMPAHAIGKDWIANNGVFAAAPSGTGFQVSVFGLFGLLAAVEEGLEVNLLSLTFGIDPTGPAIKLPGIGRLGWGER